MSPHFRQITPKSTELISRNFRIGRCTPTDVTIVRSIKGRYYGNLFGGQISQIVSPHLDSSPWHPEIVWRIATPTAR